MAYTKGRGDNMTLNTIYSRSQEDCSIGRLYSIDRHPLAFKTVPIVSRWALPRVHEFDCSEQVICGWRKDKPFILDSNIDLDVHWDVK